MSSTTACANGLDCAPDGLTCLTACTATADCVAPTADCKVVTCVGGACGVGDAPLGTACTNGGRTCDGKGVCQPGTYVFVTSAPVPANLGAAASNGALAYDAQCLAFARAQGYQGSWMAWMSDATNSPSGRFDKTTPNYMLLDGTVIAVGWANLVSGNLSAGITLSETGSTVGNSEVWTGTSSAGTALSSCTNWSDLSASDSGEVGDTTLMVTLADWTEIYLQQCSRNNVHVYCFQQ
jgi:hypothetical protein